MFKALLPAENLAEVLGFLRVYDLEAVLFTSEMFCHLAAERILKFRLHFLRNVTILP